MYTYIFKVWNNSMQAKKMRSITKSSCYIKHIYQINLIYIFVIKVINTFWILYWYSCSWDTKLGSMFPNNGKEAVVLASVDFGLFCRSPLRIKADRKIWNVVNISTYFFLFWQTNLTIFFYYDVVELLGWLYVAFFSLHAAVTK